MEKITSRKNAYIQHLRKLNTDAKYRASENEALCDGTKLLDEAIASGIKIKSLLYPESEPVIVDSAKTYVAPNELVEYVSPRKSGNDLIFSFEIEERKLKDVPKKVVVLENVQDPGNMGTIIRTANALGVDLIILVGACADIWSAKVIRATMGAVFRQCIMKCDIENLADLLKSWNLKLCGTALTDRAKNINEISLENVAMAMGNEGSGLSEEFLEICENYVIIPMQNNSESLNVAVAATIVCWEMCKNN